MTSLHDGIYHGDEGKARHAGHVVNSKTCKQKPQQASCSKNLLLIPLTPSYSLSL
jgi:hypothetical protein